MELKPGFKQTEVGVIPEDWEISNLGSLGIFSKGNGIKKDEANSGDIPCVRYGEIYTFHNDIVRSFNSSISEVVAKGSKLLRYGDILFAGSGETREEIGKSVAFIEHKVAYAGGDIVILSNTKESPSFLGYQLNSSTVARQKSTKGQGDAVVHISASALSTVLVPIPPTKAEQEAIAGALSDADELIASLEQLIEKKRMIKQGAMQELLTGKKRLPGFQQKPGYKQTEVGEIPEDWEIVHLGKLLNETPSYGINAAAIPDDSRFPTYIRITDITEDGRYSNESSASVSHPDSLNYTLTNGDLVFARTGASVGKSYLYDKRDGVLVYAGFLIRIKPAEDLLSSYYLKYVVQTKSYWTWVRLNSQRSGQPGINGKQLAALPLPMPPTKAEQEAIAAVLSDMDAEIEALEQKLEKARKIKAGMMHNLLTGTIRLV